MELILNVQLGLLIGQFRPFKPFKDALDVKATSSGDPVKEISMNIFGKIDATIW